MLHHDSSSKCFPLTTTCYEMVLCLQEGFLEIVRATELQCIRVKPSGSKTSWLSMCINKVRVRMIARYNPDRQNKICEYVLYLILLYKSIQINLLFWFSGFLFQYAELPMVNNEMKARNKILCCWRTFMCYFLSCFHSVFWIPTLCCHWAVYSKARVTVIHYSF